MSSSVVPILWIAWAVIVVITALLYAYRTSLTRDEEGQIFLDPAFDHEKAVQTQIVSKVNSIQPAVRAALALSAAMTAVVVGYYLWNAFKQLFG